MYMARELAVTMLQKQWRPRPRGELVFWEEGEVKASDSLIKFQALKRTKTLTIGNRPGPGLRKKEDRVVFYDKQ